MAVKITAFANCDDAVAFWRIDEPIPGCLGFALERETVDAQGKRLRSFVENRTGFAAAPGKPGEHRPSNEWPFQRFGWTDHKMDLGDRVRYRVTPVVKGPAGTPALATELQSEWTDEVELTGDAGPAFSFFFNRGLVISQFMSRYLNSLRKPGETFGDVLGRFKQSLSEHETPIRQFLSGDLRTALLSLLAKTKEEGGHIHAALFELSDPELLAALSALGARAHVVLANGSVDHKGEDENSGARTALRAAGAEVFDRMVAPKPLGHNKFLVVSDAGGTPRAVWTGSTNWAPTGLCTQINNALLVRDEGLAKIYSDQWERLRAAGSAYPPELVEANTQPKRATVDGSEVTAWFTRTQGGVDLDALRAEVEGAREAVLFLMFQPGPKGLYRTVREVMAARPELYVHGVVSTLPTPDDESRVDVKVTGPGGTSGVSLDVVQPEGIRAPFASWAEEVTRKEFLDRHKGIGHAIVHSKLVVIDPFTNPVVITGSHNFSGAASTANDENFVIIRGNARLAQGYAVHVLSVFQHYRWQAYVAAEQAAGRDPWSGLSDDPAWQSGHLKGPRRREMEFWVR